MENLRLTIIEAMPERLTPTPKDDKTPVKFGVADFQYNNHNAGFITQMAKRLHAGQRIVMECYGSSLYNANEYYLAATLYFGLVKVMATKKALRFSYNKDLEGPKSECLIASWYPQQVNDPVAIATELAFFVKTSGYNYVREQVIPAKKIK